MIFMLQQASNFGVLSLNLIERKKRSTPFGTIINLNSGFIHLFMADGAATFSSDYLPVDAWYDRLLLIKKGLIVRTGNKEC